MGPMEDKALGETRPLPTGLEERIRDLFSDVDARIRTLGVGCWAHGDCCDFERSEHRLYASQLEIAFVRETRGGDLDAAARGDRPGNANATDRQHLQQNERLCPFWIDGRCTERERRPLGCRTFFCDPRYRDAVEALYEEYLAKLRLLADAYGVPWGYRPFVAALREERPRSLSQ